MIELTHCDLRLNWKSNVGVLPFCPAEPVVRY
jgi:hypothetical protein